MIFVPCVILLTGVSKLVVGNNEGSICIQTFTVIIIMTSQGKQSTPRSEMESCMIKLPLLAVPSMIKLLAFNFFMCDFFSAFSFLRLKFFGFRLLAFSLKFEGSQERIIFLQELVIKELGIKTLPIFKI